MSSDMAADDTEAPVLSEDEVRGGCGPRGGSSWRGWWAIGARAWPRAPEPGRRRGRGGERRARGRCGSRSPPARLAARGLGPFRRPPGGAWLQPGSPHPLPEGDGLGGAASRDSASSFCRSGSRPNLATLPTMASRRPGWERRGEGGGWDSFDSAAIDRCGKFTLCFKAFVSIFEKNEGQRSTNTLRNPLPPQLLALKTAAQGFAAGKTVCYRRTT